MHGADAGEGYHDIEGEILGAIRNKMGWYIPIGVALDLHENITQKMVDCSDILIGCSMQTLPSIFYSRIP